MKQACVDFSVFFKHFKWNLKGLSGTYVDDPILTESSEFKTLNENNGGQVCFSRHEFVSLRFPFSSADEDGQYYAI